DEEYEVEPYVIIERQDSTKSWAAFLARRALRAIPPRVSSPLCGAKSRATPAPSAMPSRSGPIAESCLSMMTYGSASYSSSSSSSYQSGSSVRVLHLIALAFLIAFWVLISLAQQKPLPDPSTLWR